MKFKWKLQKTDILQMIVFYKDGYTINSLAKYYQVDHSSIIYHLKRYNIQKINGKKQMTGTYTDNRKQIFTNEKINDGLECYDSYLFNRVSNILKQKHKGLSGKILEKLVNDKIRKMKKVATNSFDGF